MAAPTIGVTLIKRFTYRANTAEEFSNHYWFTGTTPTDSTAWKTFTDLLITEEKKCYPTNASVIAAYGYDSTDEHATAVYARDMTIAPDAIVAGTMATTGGLLAPGDCAVWVRWGLDRLNSKGKRIYLRKYFHPAVATTGNTDQVLATAVTALNGFATTVQTGLSSGTYKITDTRGSTVLNHGASTYVTTRTLKRRGKRPPT